MTDLRSGLEHALALTGCVQALIEEGDWPTATALDQQRQKALHDFCATLDPKSAPPDLIAVLTEILKLNDALIGAVQHRQRALLREADLLRTGQRAVAAYAAETPAGGYPSP